MTDSFSDPEDFARSVERLIQERGPAWQVEIFEQQEPTGSRTTCVKFSHPLSEGFVLSWLPNQALSLEELEDWLSPEERVGWELEFLSTAPDRITHPETVRQLIRRAEIFAWTNEEVSAIADLLFRHEGVSEKEHEWLSATVGEEAPNLPRVNPAPRRYFGYTPPLCKQLA